VTDHFKVNQKDIFFILKEQLNYASLCSLDGYKEIDENMLDMVITEAINLARGEIAPLQEIGENWGVRFENGQIRCLPEFKKAFKRFGQDGWIATARDLKYGGQGFPHMMRIVINDIMYGACQAFNMATSLTHGAAHLIESFAEEVLKRRFVPRMFAGDWSGTMCLTEPDAGSDLSEIQTTAFREWDHFKIKGSKIFISWGDHDLTENIIHLLFARIEGAPKGVKVISLFIVPKIRVEADGSLGDSNDVLCERVEEKLGLHASPTCELNFGSQDDCIGYLFGEENRGLAHMFQMMNSARTNTGVSGMTLASTAYRNALAYARERLQGPDLTRKKQGKVTIINHPDVRRMLLWMKATVDGMRSMIYTGAFWSDLALEMPGGDRKSHFQALTDFVTPIIKAFCSDMGFRVCEQAIQCLGGSGFCKAYPVEQYLRDAKIMSLYEGTNGIQSIDLMGRKMHIEGGASFKAYMKELETFLKKNAEHETLKKEIGLLKRVSDQLKEASAVLSMRMKSDPLQWASYTYPALLCFGEVTMVWHLLDMAVIAQKAIDEGKEDKSLIGRVMQATYFAGVTLPTTMARLGTCLRKGREIVDMPEEAF
jgi:alkylation response protein AidB-like acyl-CoA dehydrogenase